MGHCTIYSAIIQVHFAVWITKHQVRYILVSTKVVGLGGMG